MSTDLDNLNQAAQYVMTCIVQDKRHLDGALLEEALREVGVNLEPRSLSGKEVYIGTVNGVNRVTNQSIWSNEWATTTREAADLLCADWIVRHMDSIALRSDQELRRPTITRDILVTYRDGDYAKVCSLYDQHFVGASDGYFDEIDGWNIEQPANVAGRLQQLEDQLRQPVSKPVTQEVTTSTPAQSETTKVVLSVMTGQKGEVWTDVLSSAAEAQKAAATRVVRKFNPTLLEDQSIQKIVERDILQAYRDGNYSEVMRLYRQHTSRTCHILGEYIDEYRVSKPDDVSVRLQQLQQELKPAAPEPKKVQWLVGLSTGYTDVPVRLFDDEERARQYHDGHTKESMRAECHQIGLQWFAGEGASLTGTWIARIEDGRVVEVQD